MAAPLLTQEEQEQDRLEEIAKATEEEAKKNKKPKKQKEFDEQGVRTIMDPQVKERASNMHKRATTLIGECHTLISDVRRSVLAADFRSALSTLEGRVNMLAANITEFNDDDRPMEKAQEVWDA